MHEIKTYELFIAITLKWNIADNQHKLYRKIWKSHSSLTHMAVSGGDRIVTFIRDSVAVRCQGGGAGNDCLNLNFRQNFP